MSRISRMRLLFASNATVVLSANQAFASQGPGTSAGTASPFTQMAMAITVYGLCAAAIAAGAIGVLRKD